LSLKGRHHSSHVSPANIISGDALTTQASVITCLGDQFIDAGLERADTESSKGINEFRTG
jgi:hypothetical protein